MAAEWRFLWLTTHLNIHQSNMATTYLDDLRVKSSRVSRGEHLDPPEAPLLEELPGVLQMPWSWSPPKKRLRGKRPLENLGKSGSEESEFGEHGLNKQEFHGFRMISGFPDVPMK